MRRSLIGFASGKTLARHVREYGILPALATRLFKQAPQYASMSFLFDDTYYKVGKNGVSPFQNMHFHLAAKLPLGSDGFEKVLIGTRGARETFLRGRKGRAAKNSVLTRGEKQLKC